jgi:hypothetical protein
MYTRFLVYMEAAVRRERVIPQTAASGCSCLRFLLKAARATGAEAGPGSSPEAENFLLKEVFTLRRRLVLEVRRRVKTSF